MLTLFNPNSILSELNDSLALWESRSPVSSTRRDNKYFRYSDKNNAIFIDLPGIDPACVEIYTRKINNLGDTLRVIARVYDTPEKLYYNNYVGEFSLSKNAMRYDQPVLSYAHGRWIVKLGDANISETRNETKLEMPTSEYKLLKPE